MTLHRGAAALALAGVLAACGGGEEPAAPLSDLDRARNLCTLLAGAAIRCDVNTFAARVEAVLPGSNEAEAENLCAMVAQQMAQRAAFERSWELHLSSTESIRPIATCTLR